MHRFSQVDVFADRLTDGNPLAVVHDADDLNDDQLATIASWTNLSETAFLLHPTVPGADYRVRIFTVEQELPFAGHPTLGSAAAWLAAGGRPRRPGRLVQECGAGLVPIAGIIIGGAMTATSLAGRRAFAALRDEHGTYEAALSIGLPRSAAVTEVIERHLPEALVPGMDQTRTVGLVTLPGAFVGVLLGGGSPVQAGAAQIIVLVGLLATQAITVVVVGRLIRSARLLPADLKDRLIP